MAVESKDGITVLPNKYAESEGVSNNPLSTAFRPENANLVLGRIATVHRPGDFVDLVLNGHDDVKEAWFRVVGPSTNNTLPCGLERPLRAQFLAQGYGTYKVTFTDGQNDLGSAELDIERDDIERDVNGNPKRGPVSSERVTFQP
jgi:hypothetical protein